MDQTPVCEERFGSPIVDIGDSNTARKLYQAQWYEDEVEAFGAIIATSPAEYEGMHRQRISGLQEVAPFIWFADVEYGERSSEVGSWERTFDTTGGTSRITQSLGTRSKIGIGGMTAPDFGGAIGVTENGVEGCDITVPRLGFTVTYNFNASFVTPSYEALCASLTGKVNAASFSGYAARTVLYLGASGRYQGSLATSANPISVAVSHHFAVSPNIAISIAGSQLQKLGWDYMWTRYLEKIDQQSMAKIPYPVAAYSEIVYEDGNFGALGLVGV